MRTIKWLRRQEMIRKACVCIAIAGLIVVIYLLKLLLEH